MPEGALVAAFRECGPWGTGDAAEDARRAAGFERIYLRLHELAGRMRPDGSASDAASVVAQRLLQAGPRGERPGDPYTTDAMVDCYLKRALRNGLVDEERGKARGDELGPSLVSPIWSPAETLDRSRADRAIEEAVTCLFDRIVPGLGETVVEAVQDRRAVAEGRKTFDQCIAERHGSVTVQTRNRFYQRQTRAMRRVAAAVESHIVANGLSVVEAWALRVVLEELRDADAGWRVGPGGA